MTAASFLNNCLHKYETYKYIKTNGELHKQERHGIAQKWSFVALANDTSFFFFLCNLIITNGENHKDNITIPIQWIMCLCFGFKKRNIGYDIEYLFQNNDIS